MEPTKATLEKVLRNPKLKLREQLAEVCRFRHVLQRTENAYWHWIRGLIQFPRATAETRMQNDGIGAAVERVPTGGGWWHPLGWRDGSRIGVAGADG